MQQSKPQEKDERTPQSLTIVSMSMCAALYAIGSYLTSFIPSPWGFGQFRPAVIIPSFFATVFGPLSGAVGAAMGTLIADSLRHGRIYEGSLIAAVPGNFIGFYLFGRIVKKKFTWGRFILATNVTLTVANLTVAFLYVFVFRTLYLQVLPLLPETLSFISIGLTIWWYVTMLPFVLLFTPVLIRVVAWAVPSIIPDQVRTHSLKSEMPKLAFSLAMIVPGVVMLIIGVISTVYIGFGAQLSLSGAALVATQTLFYACGVVLVALGVVMYVRKSLFEKLAMENKRVSEGTK